MQKRQTITDVARKAAVSQGTVSRVINGYAVRPELKQRVIAAIIELNYQPSVIAQSLRTNTTRTIGLIVTDISNQVLAIIAKSAEEVLRSLGYTLIVANSGDHPDREAELVRVLARRQVDGILITVSDEDNPQMAEALKQVNLPIVLLDRYLPIEADLIQVDHGKGMYLAVKYLLNLGHQRIALITASPSILPGRERIAGFKRAFAELNVAMSPDMVYSESLSATFGFQQAFALLNLANPPTAIIAGGNQILEGVLEAIRIKEIAVPHDLSLIACDDTPLTRLTMPAITVVSRDLSAMGRMAATTLLDRVRSGTQLKPRHVILPTELVMRASCAPCDK